MITTYFRSSSLNNWEYCQMQYFITYVLGHQSPSGQKADMGTITHAVLETLAICKKHLQTSSSKKMTISQDPLGTFSFSKDELYTDKFVNKVLDRSFKFYKENCPHNVFDDKSYEFCKKMVWDTLNYNGGQFDPRKRKIIDSEPHFDFAIDEPWAKFSFDGPSGKIEGNLAVKGTIDLITELPDGTMEIIDWKGLPITTIIPTLHGWKTMGSIEVGDYVFDSLGLPTKVLAKSSPSIKPCYNVILKTGEIVTCDDEHLWLLSDGSVKNVKDLIAGEFLTQVKEIHRPYLSRLDIHGRRSIASPPREIKSVKETEPRLTQCIMVDSPVSTYLCTGSFIPTHNTGRRLNWATGEVKDYNKLMKDTQLLLYYYAAGRLYPEYEHRLMTIFFCRDGGPFTLAYEKNEVDYFMTYMKKTFNEIVLNQNPKPLSASRSDFRCKNLCHFYKNNWPGTNKTMCHHVENQLSSVGMKETVENCSRPGFTIGTYQSPGEVSQ